MRTVPRRRRYVPAFVLTIAQPLLRFDYRRDAYVLRGVGERVGPVLRSDRRRREDHDYSGPERRDVPHRARRATLAS